MNRFKNYVLTAAGFAVLAGVISGITIAPVVAQAVKAAIIKNVDERGRVPYAVRIVCSGSGFATCTAAGSAIPTGKRFVLEHVNAQVGTGTGVNALHAIVYGPNFEQTMYLHLLLDGSPSGGPVYSANDSALIYFEAGQQPIFEVDTLSATTIGGAAYLSGYLVDLTI